MYLVGERIAMGCYENGNFCNFFGNGRFLEVFFILLFLKFVKVFRHILRNCRFKGKSVLKI